MVHGEISALSAPGLSRSRFLGAALQPAGGTTGMLYRRLTGTTARLKARRCMVAEASGRRRGLYGIRFL